MNAAPTGSGSRSLKIFALTLWVTITALHAAVIGIGARFGGIEGALIGGVFALIFWVPLTRTMLIYLRRSRAQALPELTPAA